MDSGSDSMDDLPLAVIKNKLEREIEEQDSTFDDSDKDPDYVQSKAKKSRSRKKKFNFKKINQQLKRNINEKSKPAKRNTSKYLPESDMQRGNDNSNRDESQNLDDSEIITDILEDIVNNIVRNEQGYSQSSYIVTSIIDLILRNVVSEAIESKNVLVNESYGREGSQETNEEDICRSRKRKRDPKNSKRETQKRMRYSGQEHVGPSGKRHQAKQVGPACNDSCKLQCSKNFDEESRKKIFEVFWGLEDKVAQRLFLARHVISTPAKRHLTGSKKKGKNDDVSFLF